MKKEIEIEGIGKVLMVRNKGYKNLRLSVNAKEQVRISIPYLISEREAIRFLESKKDWVIKSRHKQSQKKENKQIFDYNTQFRTQKHALQIEPHPGQNLQGQIRDRNIHIRIPESLSIRSEQAQEFIRKGIIAALRIEAKAYLPARTMELAEKFSFQVNQIRVKNNKSNWGSCSYQNNINLNIHLMRVPSYLADYVIIHELCHTIHRNHGEDFWKLLDKCCNGRAKHLAFEMKSFHPHIY